MALHFAAQGLSVLLRVLRSLFHCANFQGSEAPYLSTYYIEPSIPTSKILFPSLLSLEGSLQSYIDLAFFSVEFHAFKLFPYFKNSPHVVSMLFPGSPLPLSSLLSLFTLSSAAPRPLQKLLFSRVPDVALHSQLLP